MTASARRLPLVNVAAGVVIVVLVVASLYWARTVLMPVALAILLTFVLNPVVTALHRRGLRARAGGASGRDLGRGAAGRHGLDGAAPAHGARR